MDGQQVTQEIQSNSQRHKIAKMGQRRSFPGELGLCAISCHTRGACGKYVASLGQVSLPHHRHHPSEVCLPGLVSILNYLLETYLTIELHGRYLKDGDRRIRGIVHGSDAGSMGLSTGPCKVPRWL